MKTRTLILAGGEGTRLGVLTAKRTKPAVPFAGKYRIIDFALSNCVNSHLFDVMIIAQYRPHSLIEHIGAGGPWDLNRDFTGGVRIYTPYRAYGSNWFTGTADAVQQNFTFIKRDDPDYILLLSGDHIYTMNYEPMIQFHQEKKADLTIATLEVPIEEASRFGIVGVGEDQKVTSFVEKPASPPSNLANMGVYLFNRELLDEILWSDHLHKESSHDFGKDILPHLVNSEKKVYAYPYNGYWVDVGTINSYWQAHMDLLKSPSPINLYDRSWIIHTRTEERPPATIHQDAFVADSMICDGCIIEPGAYVSRSILSPGVHICAGTRVTESILLTDCFIDKNAIVNRTILDKKVKIGEGANLGVSQQNSAGEDAPQKQAETLITMVGRNSIIPPQSIIEPGASVGPDVIPTDFLGSVVQSGNYIQTRRLPNEI